MRDTEHGARDPMGLPPTFTWRGGVLRLLDQTLLPHRIRYRPCRTARDVHDAIRRLQVRGAPAIGCAAAYGVALGLGRSRAKGRAAVARAATEVSDFLQTARPTAVNLAWAADRVRDAVARSGASSPAAAAAVARREAHAIAREDRALCARIGLAGARLVPPGARVLTHCNAGALATAGMGTALAVVYTAARQGRQIGRASCRERVSNFV
jgi:methylthioribose-1-phosphate isomerase